MYAKELRIGNYVITDALLIPRPLIGKDKAQPMSAWGLWLYSAGEFEIQPIPLTEEWLIKFGFKNSKRTDKCYEKGINVVISMADNKFRFITGNFVCQIILKELEYVHQLQNLYFALTGTELTIK